MFKIKTMVDGGGKRRETIAIQTSKFAIFVQYKKLYKYIVVYKFSAIRALQAYH